MIQGGAQLRRQLLQLSRNAQGRALRAAVRAGIKPAQARAKQLIPVGDEAHKTEQGKVVRPGFARRSIRAIVKVSRDKTRAEALLGVRKEARYAVQFIELGSSKTPAQPWLRPAFASQQQQMVEAIAESLRKTIADAANTR